MAKKRTYKKEKTIGVGWLIPILFIVGIVPLIVFGRVLELEGLEYEAWRGDDEVFDFFSYYKAVYFSITAYIGFLIMLGLIWFKRITQRNVWLWIPMGIYLFFVFISFLTARDFTVASRGFIEQFQGVWVMMAYGLTIMTVMNLVRSEKHVRYVIGAFVLVGVVTFALGVTQYFGDDGSSQPGINEIDSQTLYVGANTTVEDLLETIQAEPYFEDYIQEGEDGEEAVLNASVYQSDDALKSSGTLSDDDVLRLVGDDGEQTDYAIDVERTSFITDFFRTETGQRLIVPGQYHEAIFDDEESDGLNFRFGQYTIYATMYNTNFVGSFAALLLPLALGLYFYAKEPKHIVAAGIFTGMMAFVAFGSNSRAGFVGLTGGLIVMAVLFRKEVTRSPLRIFIPLILLVGTGFVLNEASDGRVMHQITRLNPFEEAEEEVDDPDTDPWFEALDFEDDQLDIVTDHESVRIVHDRDEGSLLFRDLDDNALAVHNDDGNIVFEDDAINNQFDIEITQQIQAIEEHRMLLSVFTINGDYHRKFTIQYGCSWIDQPDEENSNLLDECKNDNMYYRGVGGPNHPQEAPHPSFMDGYGSFASSRGYIWSRSVGMFKDTWLIGHGPDMYTIEFPQRDYVGRLNEDVFGDHTIIDKPHNMYLQIGVNTGVVSLLALLSIFGYYIFDSIKLFIKRKSKTLLDYMGVAFLTSVIAYLGAGFFNDQIISVAPLFYVSVGIGFAINATIKYQDDIDRQVKNQ